MGDNILDIIERYESASSEVVKYQKEIIRLICNAVRDVIPDIDAWIGTIDNPNVIFFNSDERGKRFDKALDDKAFDGWQSLDSLIGDVFPELLYEVDDNCIYLSPEEQAKIKERLERLKEAKDER